MGEKLNEDDTLSGLRFIVHGFADYGNGVIEILRSGGQAGGRNSIVSRSGIVDFSYKSRSRMLFILSCSEVEYSSMATMTYGRGFPLDGRTVKGHLNRFLVAYRRKFPAHYFWFMEFQSRGAPHIHLFSQVKNPDFGHRHVLACEWASAIGLGITYQGAYCDLKTREVLSQRDQVIWVNSRREHWEAIREADGARRYAAKYALKPEQKEVPHAYRNVGRFWGRSTGQRMRQPEMVVWNSNEGNVRAALGRMGYKCSGWEYLPKFAFGGVSS